MECKYKQEKLKELGKQIINLTIVECKSIEDTSSEASTLNNKSNHSGM